jgi:hypothetical protein
MQWDERSSLPQQTHRRPLLQLRSLQRLSLELLHSLPKHQQRVVRQAPRHLPCRPSLRRLLSVAALCVALWPAAACAFSVARAACAVSQANEGGRGGAKLTLNVADDTEERVSTMQVEGGRIGPLPPLLYGCACCATFL